MYQFDSSELLGKRKANPVNCLPCPTEISQIPESLSRSGEQEFPDESKIERKLDAMIDSIESIKLYQKRTDEKLAEILQHCDLMKKRLTKSVNHVPIFIKESYTGIDNETRVVGGDLSIIVNVITKFTEDPKIYPFGFTNVKEIYKEQIVKLEVLDSNDAPFCNGTGFLRKNHQDLYVIDGLNFKIGDVDCQIEEINLPFTISCKINL